MVEVGTRHSHQILLKGTFHIAPQFIGSIQNKYLCTASYQAQYQGVSQINITLKNQNKCYLVLLIAKYKYCLATVIHCVHITTEWDSADLSKSKSPSDNMEQFLLSTHWAETKWPPFSRRHFQMHFSWMKMNTFRSRLPKSPINNIPALVQIMAWRRLGDKPLSEPMMVGFPTHLCITRPQWVNPSGAESKKNIPRQFGQYHCWWCPGSFCRHNISTHDIITQGKGLLPSLWKYFKYLCHLGVEKW